MRETIVGKVVGTARGFWDIDEEYEYLDLVYAGGALYRANEAVVPVGTPVDDNAFWDVIFRASAGATFTVWDETKPYFEGDMVLVNGSLIYRALQDVPAGSDVTDPTLWQLETTDGRTDTLYSWSKSRTYPSGAFVNHEGRLYESSRDVPIGIEITDTSYWDIKYNPSSDSLIVWDSTKSFQPDDMVLVGGQDIYKATQLVPAGTPIDGLAPNGSAYWEVVYKPSSQNIYFVWESTRPFVQGVKVLHEGVTYEALQDVPTGTAITNVSYWRVVHRPDVGDTVLAWNLNKSYEAATTVIYEGNVYEAKKAVPAGSALTDTEFWELKYHAGDSILAWDNQNTYQAGEQVLVNGNVYQAKINVTTGILITDTQYWEVIYAVTDAIVLWDGSKSYIEGATVTDNGSVYRAKLNVPVSTSLSDATYWELVYTASGDAVQAWDLNKTYNATDHVLHRGTVYRAKTNVPSDTAITNVTYWEVVYSPADPLSVWDVGSAYESGANVVNNNSIYKAKQDVPINTPITDVVYWEVIQQFDEAIRIWNNTTSYNSGAAVTLDGNIYVAKQDVPAGTSVNDTTYWDVSYRVSTSLEVWNKNNEFNADATVIHEGSIYSAKQNVPVGIEIADTQYWNVEYQFSGSLLVWSNTETYKQNDTVTHEGNIYRAKQAVTAGTSVTNVVYWDLVYELEGSFSPWVLDQAYKPDALVIFEEAIYRAKKSVPINTALTNTEYWEMVMYSSLQDLQDIIDSIDLLNQDLAITNATVHQIDVREIDVSNLLADDKRSTAALRSAFKEFKNENKNATTDAGFAFAVREIKITKNALTVQAEEIATLAVAVNDNLAIAQDYTRAAVGFCVDGDGNVTEHNDAVLCVAAGHSWTDGPLAEHIRNLQVSTSDGQTASVSNLGQAMVQKDGTLLARGSLTTNVDGRVSGFINTNTGNDTAIDMIAENFRVGDINPSTGSFDPLLSLNTDTRVLRIKGQLVLGDGFVVDAQEDIQGQSGAGIYTLTLRDGVFPSDVDATADFVSNLGRPPVLDDHLTYRNAGGTVSSTKRWSGSAWTAPTMLIHGDLLATGTVSGDRFTAGTQISAPNIVGGFIAGAQVAADRGGLLMPSDYNMELYGTMDTSVIVESGNRPYMAQVVFPKDIVGVRDPDNPTMNLVAPYEEWFDGTANAHIPANNSTVLVYTDQVRFPVAPYNDPDPDNVLRFARAGNRRVIPGTSNLYTTGDNFARYKLYLEFNRALVLAGGSLDGLIITVHLIDASGYRFYDRSWYPRWNGIGGMSAWQDEDSFKMTSYSGDITFNLYIRKAAGTSINLTRAKLSTIVDINLQNS